MYTHHVMGMLVLVFMAVGLALHGPGSWTLELAAALLASLPSNAVRIPAEVLKQRVQAQVEKDSFTAAKNIIRDEGVSGLYQGGGAQLIRELPFNAVQFMVFGSLINHMTELHMHTGLAEKVRGSSQSKSAIPISSSRQFIGEE